MMRSGKTEAAESIEGVAGFIQLVFIDHAAGQVISLGGAGYLTDAEYEAAWAVIPSFDGESAFVAARLDGSGEMVDERPVSAETCEGLLGCPITDLISKGRAKYKAYLESSSPETRPE